MGNCKSKGDNVRRNKNHNRQKMFRIGISIGRNDLNLEGHLQLGYSSKTIKNYKPIESAANEKGSFEASETRTKTLLPNNVTTSESENLISEDDS